MSENYQAPAGEPSRPLPPYRPVGPQAGAPAMFSPIPSQSTAPQAPPSPPPYQAPAPAVPAAAYQPGPSGPPSYAAPAQATSFSPQGPGTTSVAGARTFMPAAPAPVAPVQVPAPQPPAEAAARPAAPARDRAQRRGMGQEQQEGDLPIDEILTEMVRVGASDVHLTTGTTPMVRINGSLKALDGFGQVMPEGLRRTLYSFLTQKQREKFEANLELDLSYSVRGLARFRVNIYQQRESSGLIS